MKGLSEKLAELQRDAADALADTKPYPQKKAEEDPTVAALADRVVQLEDIVRRQMVAIADTDRSVGGRVPPRAAMGPGEVPAKRVPATIPLD